MGALAPMTSWSPEDDLLLKNAVEAGASLESLAKGAVQFSRRFTVRELQNRWHSLLYDPVISAEASSHMIAVEHSSSMLPSKPNRFGNLKENKSVCGKRKVGSVRSYYYALRKRICNEPFNCMDLSFLVAPGSGNYIGNEEEPFSGDCMHGDPISDHFGLQESNLDVIHHAFPQNLMDSGTATSGTAAVPHAFDPGLEHPGGENFHIEQDNTHQEIPHLFAESLPFTRSSSGDEELVQTKKFPAHNLFKSEDLVADPSSTFDHIDTDPRNICSEFEGNQVFNSPISECGASFHNLEFSSPLHGMPIWRTVEGIAEPSLPVDVSLGEKAAFELPADDDAKNTTASGYGGHLDSKLKIEMPCDGLKSPSASAEGYLAELSNSLLNFTNEEELLFIDVDGKDVIDKSYYDGLSSLLLNSPNDVSQDLAPNISEPETLVAMDICLENLSVGCLEALEDHGKSHCGDEDIAQDSGANKMSSLSASISQLPDPCEGVTCTLNTEDPEIPCNDDFVPANQKRLSSMSFVAQQNLQGANNPTIINGISSSQRTCERGSILMREGKNTGESHASSKMIGSHVLTSGNVKHAVDDGVKFEFPNGDYQHVASRGAGVACGGTNHINSVIPGGDSFRPMLKEEVAEVSPRKCHSQTDSFTKRPPLGSDSFDGCAQAYATGIKREVDVWGTIRDYHSTQAEGGPVDIAVSEPVGDPLITDQEEPPVESDDDVPHFSDIEAMILDRDLDPEDHDLYSSEEVSRYQHEDTKRALIRLEQGAHSYTQRAIASHGAFAILYGRHSKHYIKKPEVLLGRATEDVIVDVDLGREGHTNKISRRQAIIKMDKSGSFYLKNLGKCSISVNNKEVGPGQSLSLMSSCLIEIRGMPFIFETNQSRVKQYLGNISKNDQTQEHQP